MRAWLCAVAWLLLALGARATVLAPADAEAAAQQILVMLPMPPPHYRAGSDYAGSYGDVLGHRARQRLAQELAREHGLQPSSDWPMPSLGVECFVMSLREADILGRERTLRALALDARVAWVQPMNVYRAQARGQPHDDPLYPFQPVTAAWHLSELHQVSTGAGVRVAVLDSAVEVAHPDLAGQLELSENFVAAQPLVVERHGTEVAGIIAARADNRLGIAGVAPGARLLALRACWQDGKAATLCTSLSLALALDFALAKSAQVLNLSLAGPPDPLLAKLLERALARGITVVAAVDRSLPGGGFPAAHPGVFAVAAEGQGWPAAGAGVWIAPGHDVPTTGPPSRWYLVTGSSYAAAHVSGLMALLRQLLPVGAPALTGGDLARLPSGAIDACATLARRSHFRVCDAAMPAATAAAMR